MDPVENSRTKDSLDNEKLILKKIFLKSLQVLIQSIETQIFMDEKRYYSIVQ